MKKTEALENLSRLQQEVHSLASRYTRLSLPGAPMPLRGKEIARCPGTNEPAFAAQQQLELLEDTLQEAEQRYREARQIFNELLGQISDPALKTVVVLYYAMGYSDNAIADELHISTRTVNRLRNQYIRGLEGGGVS